jgi:RNA-splicing ligase RtcB/intein/homing endonuclease
MFMSEVPKQIKKVSDTVWEIPKSYKQGMRVPARIYATEKLLNNMDKGVFEQVTNVACMPGIVKHALCMPDGHWGYGFPIGGVAAFDFEEGVISPGGIGFDINCGMRLVTTNLTFKEVKPKLKELVDTFFKTVPAGVGCKGFVNLDIPTFKKIVEQGSKWCIDNGYGWDADLYRTEGHGVIDWADVSKISDRALKRGVRQLGTLGSGNHYLEIQIARAPEIHDKKLAAKFGIIEPDQVVVMVHCLPGNSKVLTEYGAWIKIKDLEKKKMMVKSFDEKTHQLVNTEIEEFYKIKGKEKLFKLKTLSGKEIIATEDHPFLTKEGLKFIQEFNIGENVAIFPFDGVEYEEPSNEIIVDEGDVKKLHDSDKIINELKSKELLPLRLNSKHLPVLAKLIGYITGDGTVRKSGRGWRIHAVGALEDLEEIKKDIKNLGFHTSKINKREGGGLIVTSKGKKIKVHGESHVIDCNSSALTLLLMALSVPEGRKTSVEFEVPKWVFKAPKWIKKLYLAGYFGAELTHPILLNSDKHLERLSLAIYKLEAIKRNGELFLHQIQALIKEFGIEGKIYEEKDGGRITKYGRTSKLVLRISSKLSNLINFWSKIGYEYSKRKIVESSQSLHYLESKQNKLNLTAKKFNVSTKSVKFTPYRYGISHGSISHFINTYKFNPPTPVRWDVVESIEEMKNEENFVYDIRVKNQNHNFIADNFVVGNCGSRGFGHEVASNYLKVFDESMKKNNIKIKDRELACAPFQSKEGQDYFKAMACAANMAFANRQVILHRIREGFEKVFNKKAEDMDMNLVYDVAHNIAKVEEHKVDGKKRKLIVHRKGSTRAFGPGHEELIKEYKETGQPVIIGGSMETGSHLLVGTEKAMEETFGSTAHGSGRTMSRTKAKQMVQGQDLLKKMECDGIYVRSVSMKGLAEEAGFAYKDINEVVKTLQDSGISKRVVGLRPIGNVKG